MKFISRRSATSNTNTFLFSAENAPGILGKFSIYAYNNSSFYAWEGKVSFGIFTRPRRCINGGAKDNALYFDILSRRPQFLR